MKMLSVTLKKKNEQNIYLVGAGLAEFEGVRGRDIVLPNAEMPSFPVTLVIDDPPTDNFDGAPDRVALLTLVGMRDGVASSANVLIDFMRVFFIDIMKT